MAALLALGSALFYGIADFIGGLLSRRADPMAVALIGQVGAFVLTLAVAPLVPSSGLQLQDVGWGALSGAGTGIGMAFLYRGLSQGSMSVVVPLVAVGGTALPVLVGVALLGDRPAILSWLGIGLAIPALWLIAITRRNGSGTVGESGAMDAVLSSFGIALQYLALAQAGAEAGLWPIVAGRAVASIAILPLVRRPQRLRGISARIVILAVATGGIAALALTLYMLAAQRQLVTIAVVLSSLYPVVPVLLGVTVLRERLTIRQVTGLFTATIAVMLITMG